MNDHCSDDNSFCAGGDHLENDKEEEEDLGTAGAAATIVPFLIKVEGAGTAAVNGIYEQDGYFQNAVKYSKKDSSWYGNRGTFYIFQCLVRADNNNTNKSNHIRRTTNKDWFISIVPSGCEPGQDTDIDFYRAYCTPRTKSSNGDEEEEYGRVPPLNGWIEDLKGESPAPVLSFFSKETAEGGGVERNETGAASMRKLILAEEKINALKKQNEALKQQNRALSTQKEALEQEKVAWLQEKDGFLKQTQVLEKEKEDLLVKAKQQQQEGSMQKLLEQHKETETKLQTEIASLRATVNDYKQKELDQLKASNQALQDRVTLLEQKEKQDQEKQRMELVEKIAKYEQTTRALQEELIRKGAQVQVTTHISRGGGSGCHSSHNNDGSSLEESKTKLPAVVPTTPTPPRTVKRARHDNDDDHDHDENSGGDGSGSL